MIVWVVTEHDTSEFGEHLVLGVFSSKRKAHEHLWGKVNKHENFDHPVHDVRAKFDESIRAWLHSDKVEGWHDFIWWDDIMWSISPILVDSPHAETYGCNPAYPESIKGCKLCSQAEAAWPAKEVA